MRKIACVAVIVLAAGAAACGSSTQGLAGTAPSLVSPIGGAADGAGSFSLLKEGKGKGHSDVGTIPTVDADEPEADDAGESGHGHDHGKAAIQYEGFTTLISGTCPGNLTIAFDDDLTDTPITTGPETEFQRGTCEALLAAGDSPVHVHIAAKKMDDDSLVAIYVRMQGPKFDDGDE